jgi:hypothetical protein
VVTRLLNKIAVTRRHLRITEAAEHLRRVLIALLPRLAAMAGVVEPADHLIRVGAGAVVRTPAVEAVVDLTLAVEAPVDLTLAVVEAAVRIHIANQHS